MINEANKLFNQAVRIWDEYVAACDELKAQSTLSRTSLKRMMDKVAACARQLTLSDSAAPLVPVPQRVVTLLDKTAINLHAKAGAELFETRDSEGDCVVKVCTSHGDLITSQNAHIEQLKPFSQNFSFIKDSAEANKATLKLTFDGSEEQFTDLLRFMHTGALKTGPYTAQDIEAILAFAARYGIKQLQHPHIFTPKKPDLLHLVQNLDAASTLEQVQASWQAIVDRGLPQNNTTLCTICSILQAKEQKLGNEICPFIMHLNEFSSHIDIGSLPLAPLKCSTVTHSVLASPFLKLAMENMAAQNASLRVQALPRSIYCVEPSMGVIKQENSLYGFTYGYITDETGENTRFYKQAHPDNPKVVAFHNQLQPGRLQFSDIHGHFLYEASEPQHEPFFQPLCGTVYPEADIIELEECRQTAKLHAALTLHKKLAEIFNQFMEQGAAIQAKKRISQKKDKEDLQYYIPDYYSGTIVTLNMIRAIANNNKGYKILEKVETELVVDHASSRYQFALPQNCLAVQSLNKNQCKFEFKEGGKELVLPNLAVKGKMVHADAGFGLNAREFVLPGHAEDFENRAIACFLKSEELPDEEVSITQLARLLCVADQWEMTDLVEQALACYVDSKKTLQTEALSFGSFKQLKAIMPHSRFMSLLSCEGGVTQSDDFLQRIEYLLPREDEAAGVKDEKNALHRRSLECLGRPTSVQCVCDVLLWADKNGFSGLHKHICAIIMSIQKKYTFMDLVQLIGAGFSHSNFSFKNCPSPTSPQEFSDAIRALWYRKPKAEGIQHTVNQGLIQALKMYYCDAVAAEADLPVDSPRFIVHYIHTSLDFPDKATNMNAKVNNWIKRQSDEKLVTELKTWLNACAFFPGPKLLVPPIEAFVKLSKTLIDERTGKKIITDESFRKQIEAYYVLKEKAMQAPSK